MYVEYDMYIKNKTINQLCKIAKQQANKAGNTVGI